MVRRFSSLVFAIIAFCFFANTRSQAQSQPLMTRHLPQVILDGQARYIAPVPGTQPMRVTIMLPLRNQPELDALLQSLYDPQSSAYRNWLSTQEFTERFGPTQQDYNAVIRFAGTYGLKVVSTASNRLLVDVSGTAVNIEQAFNVNIGFYRHPDEDRVFYAPDREPTAGLDVPLWHVEGLDNASLPRPASSTRTTEKSLYPDGSGPSGAYLGSDMRSAYYGGTVLSGTGQSLGLFALEGWDPKDIALYFTTVKQPLNVPVNCVPVDPVPCASNGDDLETAADIEQAISMAPGLTQVLVYVGTGGATTICQTCISDIFNRMATDNIAKQLSSSWAWGQAEPNTDDPIFKEFAAQGQSFFVASGDNGSYKSSSASYPAEDAWVTSVGGTDLSINGDGSWSSETAWAGSGGGISPNKIPIPTYQQEAGVITPAGGGSTTYRNIPDVAAEANDDNYVCANGSCAGGKGGTSLAAPRWAGFMALVNQLAVASGRSTLGFLNPDIYAIGLSDNYDSDFHDITSGGNGGFSAVSGYDLVTGWGSPNGQALIDELVGLSGDLVETSVTNPPAALLDGGTFSVTDTVKNTGSSPASPSVTRYYIATTTLKSSGRLMSGQRSVPSLNSGATSSGTVTVTAPAGIPAGAYFLLACPNDLDGAGFGNQKNCKASTSQVTASGPDLTETSVTSPPGTVLIDAGFSVTDTVKNVGNSAAGASTTRYYLSSTPSKTGSSVLLTGSRSVPALTVNAVSTGTVTATIPPTATPGTYYLLACADDTKLIAESNEGNNCKAASGTTVLTLAGGGTIRLGQTVAGKLTSSASAGHCRSGVPANRWKFTLSAPTTVTIEADSTAFDTDLCLLSSTNGYMTSDDNSGPGSNARIVYQNLAVGTYYIEVYSSSGSGGGAYTLSLKSGLPPGKAIGLGQTLSSTLSTAEAKGACRNSVPTDRWQFTLSATTTVTIEADSTAFDTDLCLLSATNGYMTSDDNSGPGSNARIVYQNLSVGTYYIEVYSSSGSGGGAYTLSLKSGLPPGKAIAVGQTLSGTLSTAEAKGACRNGVPTDRWQFTLSAATTVTIEADSTAFDTDLCLLSSTNGYMTSDDNSGPGSNARIVYQNLSAGTYYIEVYSSSGSGGGAYTLSLKSGLPPGKAIAVGQTLSSTLSSGEAKGACRNGTPTDRWQFTLSAATTVTIEADSTAFDSYLCLLGSTNGYMTSDDNSGPGSNARIVYQNLSVGTYYIEVYSSSGSGGGAYTLSLKSGLPPGKAIAVGQTLSGTLSTGEAKGACRNGVPTDRWQFTWPAEKTATIEADSTAFDSYLCLLSSTNGYMASDDNFGSGSNARIVYQNLAVGTYYIEVYSSSGTGGGAYKLSLQ